MNSFINPIGWFYRAFFHMLKKAENRILADPAMLERIKHFFCLLPINNHKVVFNSFKGAGYGENPKYIAEEILKRKGTAKLVWIVNSDKHSFPEGVIPVKNSSLRAYYESATAKVWVYNARVYRLTEKRRGQIYLQTWHGGIALKKIEKDAEDKLPKSYIVEAKADGRVTDGIIVDGSMNERIYRSSFWLNPKCEFLKFGQPRIDILLKEKNNERIKTQVKEALGVDQDSYFVLYAPTFRQTKSTDGYINDYPKVEKALQDRFGKVTLGIRLHPNLLSDKAIVYDYIASESLIDVSAYPDVQELIIAADCLISDYSSIIYDFALIRKPVFLLVKDIDEYIHERGVYAIFYDQPFSLNYNEKMLVEEIALYSIEDMHKRIDAFYDKYPTYNEGKAAEQTVDWLINKGLQML